MWRVVCIRSVFTRGSSPLAHAAAISRWMAISNLARADVRGLIARYVEECFQVQSSPQVSELARQSALSCKKLNRICKDQLRQGTARALRGAQVEHAKELLESTGLSMNQVAYRSGFGTRRTFFRVFRCAVGLTPNRYRLRAASRRC